MSAFRTALSCALAASAALLACLPVSADPYPAKPVKIIVTAQPGGIADIIGRLIAQPLTAALGQPVILENKSGAGGVIGTEAGVKSPADGYTLTLLASAYTISPSLYKLSFDPVNDITPIVRVSAEPLIVVANPSLSVKNIQELIAAAKAKPEGLNYASAGQGTPPHLAAELFARMAGIKLNHVPYKGGGPAIADTVAGQTDMFFSPSAVAMPHIRAGKLRALAVTSAQRHPSVPDVPTIAESGFSGYDVTLWVGLIGPRGLPRSIVERVNGDVTTALNSPETRERFQANGSSPVGGTPEQFLVVIQREIELWRKVVREAGVKPE